MEERKDYEVIRIPSTKDSQETVSIDSGNSRQ